MASFTVKMKLDEPKKHSLKFEIAPNEVELLHSVYIPKQSFEDPSWELIKEITVTVEY